VQQARSGHPGTPMAMAPVVIACAAAPPIRQSTDLAEPRTIRAFRRSCLDVALFDALLTALKAVNPKYNASSPVGPRR